MTLRLAAFVPASLFVSLAALSVVGLGACGSDDPATPPTGAEDDAGGGGGDDASPPLAPATITFAPEVIRLVRPQALSATVTIDRGGRQGEASVSLVDLPAGVTGDPATIAADATSVEVAIRATDTAAFGGPKSFRVRATIAGETVETSARVVVAGTPGSPDTSFAGTGTLTARFSTGADIPRGLAVGPEGEVYVSGGGSDGGVPKAFLLKLTPTGEPDPTFGTDGKIPGFSTSSYFHHVIAFAGGVIVSGIADVGGANEREVRKLDATGALDTMFGDGGRVLLSGFEPLLLARPGGGFFTRTENGFVLYGATGALDASFAPTVFGANAVTLDGQGRLISCMESGGGFLLRRFLPTGAPDSSFGTAGVANIPVGALDEAPNCRSVRAQKDGKIVFGGWIQRTGPTDRRGILVRALENGTLDSSFGTDGYLHHGPDATDTLFNNLDIDADDKILVQSYEGGATTVRRYTADGAPDGNFSAVGNLMLVPDHPGTIAVDRVAGRVVVTGRASPTGDGARVWRHWL